MISFKNALKYWLKLGFISFGGPTGQIAMMHKEIVINKKWIDDNHFMQALNFCMLLPGPEAHQLVTYIGWLMHRTKGGIAAGLLFIIPAVFILGILSYFYLTMGNISSVSSIFYGLKPAVVAIVAEAVLRIGKRSFRTKGFIIIALISFVSIYFFNVPFPVIILSAGILGYLFTSKEERIFVPNIDTKAYSMDYRDEKRSILKTFKIVLICLLIWLFPLILIGIWKGMNNIFMDIGILFSKAAIVTFGGAYAVLSYITQQAVMRYEWLTPAQMMDGLAMAETTPGPLIMVNQFVAFTAAFQNSEGLDPLLAGIIGGLIATWVTFAPSFLFIFAGAPYMERLRGNIRLGTALAAITAAVVGVILNLAVVFTSHVLFPAERGFDPFAFIMAVITFLGLQYLKLPIIAVIMGSAFAGYIWKVLL